jgi:HEAT repeat protein
MGDTRAVEPLIGMLVDREELVRQAGATALGAIGDSRAVEALRQASEDTEEAVRQAAEKALAKIAAKRDSQSSI